MFGRSFIQILKEKKLPITEYIFFASYKSAGNKITFLGKEYIIKELVDSSFNEGFDFALFSAGGEISKHFAPIAAKNNCIVIDNSSAFRMNPKVPLIVPEVNSNDIKWNKGIISNPNCSTIQAVVALKPLDDKYTLKRIVFSTYQAVSGAGKNGITDLENGLLGLPPQKFPYPIVNNCIPQIDTFTENGYTKEELKIIDETRKILGKPGLKITATTVRVPVLNSHSESINVEFENDFDLDELKSLLKNSPGIILEDDITKNIYPLAINASGFDEVFVRKNKKGF